MGAIADAMMRYAQPLVDTCDGSQEELQKSYMLAQLCWNATLVSEATRAEYLAEMRPAFNMNDEEYLDFLQNVVEPMVQRHHEMFPEMRVKGATALSPASSAPRTKTETKYPGTGRNEPCPCGSRKKYKRCCGR